MTPIAIQEAARLQEFGPASDSAKTLYLCGDSRHFCSSGSSAKAVRAPAKFELRHSSQFGDACDWRQVGRSPMTINPCADIVGFPPSGRAWRVAPLDIAREIRNEFDGLQPPLEIHACIERAARC
jgi:hypothetical protein